MPSEPTAARYAPSGLTPTLILTTATQTSGLRVYRHLESRAKASARLVLEVSAGWASPSSRGLWGGDALLLSTGAAGNRNLRLPLTAKRTSTQVCGAGGGRRGSGGVRLRGAAAGGGASAHRRGLQVASPHAAAGASARVRQVRAHRRGLQVASPHAAAGASARVRQVRANACTPTGLLPAHGLTWPRASRHRLPRRHVSLPNIWLRREVLPEALFFRCTGPRLAELVAQLLEDPARRDAQRRSLRTFLATLAPAPTHSQVCSPTLLPTRAV